MELTSDAQVLHDALCEDCILIGQASLKAPSEHDARMPLVATCLLELIAL